MNPRRLHSDTILSMVATVGCGIWVQSRFRLSSAAVPKPAASGSGAVAAILRAVPKPAASGSSVRSGYPPPRPDADLRVPLRERPPLRGHAEDHRGPRDHLPGVRRAGPAGVPPRRRALQGLRLLQHGL